MGVILLLFLIREISNLMVIVGEILCNDIGRGFHFSFRTLGPIESHSDVVTQDKKIQRPAGSGAPGE